MARLGDFATLLQLGFGLNAALPAIFVIYERAEEIVGAADGKGGINIKKLANAPTETAPKSVT